MFRAANARTAFSGHPITTCNDRNAGGIEIPKSLNGASPL
jgi:hypothetical protein